MKFAKKAVSAITAVAMSAGTAALFPMSASAEAVDWDKVLTLNSDWLPQDFESAMDFYNTYGSTMVKDDFICIISHVPDSYKMEADIRPVHISDEAIAASEYEYKIFTYDFKLPEEPDKSDAKAYANYLDVIDRYKFMGIDERGVGFHYEALVILNNVAKGFDVDVSLKNTKTGESDDSMTYSFEKKDEKMTETDIYGWLPDSVPEFEEYIKKNGNISYKDGMLIFCDSVNYSTGASLNIEQTGSGKLKLAVGGGAHRDYVVRPTGGASSIINVYKGEKEGDVDITFTSGRAWDTESSDHKVITASVHVDKDLNIAERGTTLPDWIPQDAESAVSFYNEHGASFVKDGVICLVRSINPDRNDEYPVRFEGSAAEKIKSCELFNDICTGDNKAYNVMAYDIPKYSDITVKFNYGRFKESERTVKTYSFKKDSTGYITQTDIYAWLPDCVSEYQAYYEKQGAFSVQDGYVMYCTSVPAAGSTVFTIGQNGAGAFIEEREESFVRYNLFEINTNDPEYSTPKYIIKLFKPIKSGAVKLDISKKITCGKEIRNEKDTAYFTITDDMAVIMGEEKDINTNIKGDCNGDGILGISDLVAIKRWLLGKGSLSEYGNADINGDGTVDIFDLVEIRKQLVSGIKEEPRPVMIFISENYAWVAHQNVTVVDQYGTAYSFRYDAGDIDQSVTRDDLLSMYNENWYDKAMEIMASDKKSAGYITDAAMAEVNKFAVNAEKYAKKELKGIGYMCDAGSSSVYVIGTDADSKPVSSKIATYGDFVGWIDEQETKDFVKMLASYDIYGEEVVNILENNKAMF